MLPKFIWLKNLETSPRRQDLKNDVTIAKNYLNVEHLKRLERIVASYLDLA
jgi:hypothetical protein